MYGEELASSFALNFLRTRNDTVFPPERTLYPSTVLVAEGQGVASFPDNNAKYYSKYANHFMLLSRASGRNFKLTNTFRDIEEKKDYIRLFQLNDDDAEKTRFCCGYS